MVKPNFERYSSKAVEIRAVLEQYDERYEAASVDEAYLNITSVG
jgi:DNA polymerase kappa